MNKAAMSTDSLPEHPDGPSLSPTQFERLIALIARSQHSYRALIDSLDQALFTLSPSGEVLVANLRLAEILGVSFSDLIGHSLSEFVESPSLAEAERALPAFLHKGSWSGTIPVKLKREKEPRYFLCWFHAISENGQVASVTGWARDVTEHAEIERRLHEEQELRRRLVANFPDLILVLDRNGRFTFVSEQVKQILGRTPEDYLGAQIGARAAPEDRARLEGMVDSILSGETNRAQLEFTAPRQDGSWRTLLATASPLFDEKGKITGVVSSARDITEARKIEKQLHQEQEFARRLIECFPHLILVLDREGRFTFVSECVKDILGVPPEEYVGKAIGHRADPDGQKKIAEMFENMISGRKRQEQIEIRAQHVDGTWRSIEINASPLYDQNGEIIGVVSSGQDVTESKRIEQQLVQKEKLAAMGQMMVGAAHELNNPLTAILGVADLLGERAHDDATRRQVDLVLKQARRAATIVQNLLAFSRPITLGREKLNLADLVKEVVVNEQAVLEQKKIRVTFQSSDDLPLVEGDRKLLKEVFVNIVINAEQAISAARDHGTLSIKFSLSGPYVRVSFTDDGSGISPESAGKIFDPFFTTKRPGGSSGLGLTICLAVVKEHGGRIETESELGSGATFHVLLPLTADEVSQMHAPAPSPATKPAPAQTSSLRGHRVVLVDDEESIREVVQEALVARGMKVEGFGSSEAALAYLAKNPCDIVVCDFHLPGMNGEQLFERLRIEQSDRMPRFVFMTGDLFDPVAAERYRRAGAAILQKPFHVSALADLLADVLRSHPAQVGELT
jgi:PAS domain S-box-containing protein